MALADPIDAADALLDPHGVPRHVVVDQRAAELEVQPFGRGVGAQQQVGVAVAEAALDLFAVDDSPLVVVADRTLAAAAGEAQQPVAPLPEGAPQKVHGVGVLREHHDLGVSVPRQLVQVPDQPSELAVRRQGGDTLQQAVYLPPCSSTACACNSRARMSSASGISSSASSSGASSSRETVDSSASWRRFSSVARNASKLLASRRR